MQLATRVIMSKITEKILLKEFKMELKGKDFITLFDFNNKEINNLIDIAIKLKQDTKEGKTHYELKDKTLAMIFAKPSLRTRVSFEVGIRQLGGHAVVLKQDEIILGERETISDTARVLSRYVNGIMIRTFAHQDVIELAKNSDIPVINALTDSYHPCQVLADLLTIKEKFGSFDNLKLTYIGDGNNMANSLIAGCMLTGIDLCIATPVDYEPDTNVIWKGKDASIATKAKIEVINDPAEAVKGANIVYTDVWASMGQEKEAQKRKKIFKNFQINKTLMNKAAEDAIVLHCLPAHRGEEITKDIMDKYADTIFEQAENRLHAQKAVMVSIM